MSSTFTPEDTDGHTVDACPYCESSDIHSRGWKPPGVGVDPHERWKCRGCGYAFPFPMERPPKKQGVKPGTGSLLDGIHDD